MYILGRWVGLIDRIEVMEVLNVPLGLECGPEQSRQTFTARYNPE
jgi:hypothetical protein